jgi:hypothetical protein
MDGIHLSVGEVSLILEALTHRANRHETYARSYPERAGPHERTAAAMRELCKRIKQTRTPNVMVGRYMRATA